MRPLREWDKADIESLIKNQVQEDLHLDYKRSEALVNNERNKIEISKDVSAFANSDGGKIVYGVIEQDHLPKEIDEGIGAEGKREWLEQVINSRIEPRILNVVINQIDLVPSNKAMFVVEIPVGITAYQAYDKRYYRRFNFQSVPMHDYEVKMTIDRFREPKIELGIDLADMKNTARQISLEVHAKNIGVISAAAAHFKLLIPKKVYHNMQGDLWYLGNEVINYEGVEVAVLMCNWGGSDQMEFFPGLMYPLSSRLLPNTICIRVREPFLGKPQEVPIFYEIYATNMKPQKGRFLFKITSFGEITRYTEIDSI